MSSAEVTVFVAERGRGADTDARVLDYLERVRALGSVEIMTGTRYAGATTRRRAEQDAGRVPWRGAAAAA